MKWLCIFLFVIGCQPQKTIHRASHFKPLPEENAPTFVPILAKEDLQTFDVMNLPEAFHAPISCRITKSVSFKDSIRALAKHLGLSIRIDPTLNHRLALTLRNEPFSHMIQSLCSLDKVRCRYTRETLCIDADQPYAKTYSLAFLNIARKAENNMRIATDVFSHDKKKEKDASNSSVSITSKSDFWDELEKTFKMMLPHGSFAFHKQAGLISLKGNSSEHTMVERYLTRLRATMSSQVLIEAKVVEVNLREDYRSGIDWKGLSRKLQFSTHLNDLSHADLNVRDAVTLTAGTKSFSAILHALDSCGETKTLASPRLTVMNNQSAILKVAKNQVYFRLNYEKQFFTSTARDSVTVSSDVHTIPIGLVLLVQPSIDMETGRVMLFLRPTLSRLNQSVNDPAIQIMTDTSQANTVGPPSPVPVVDVREIDSVLCVQSGEMAILAGLMDIRSQKDRSQIPGIGDLPLIGKAFSYEEHSDHVVELVILLRATIMQ